MMVVEFWVMRVLLHPGPMSRPIRMSHLQGDDKVRAVAMVTSGELTCLPDGCIAEPVEMFADQEAAHGHRAKLLSDNPGSDYRVVLNSNVTI